jgi:hypothetical protein
VGVLHFWRSWIDLTRSLRCFLGVFDQKQVENEFLDEKTRTLFFLLPQWSKFKEFHTTYNLFFLKKNCR